MKNIFKHRLQPFLFNKTLAVFWLVFVIFCILAGIQYNGNDISFFYFYNDPVATWSFLVNMLVLGTISNYYQGLKNYTNQELLPGRKWNLLKGLLSAELGFILILNLAVTVIWGFNLLVLALSLYYISQSLLKIFEDLQNFGSYFFSYLMLVVLFNLLFSVEGNNSTRAWILNDYKNIFISTLIGGSLYIIILTIFKYQKSFEQGKSNNYFSEFLDSYLSWGLKKNAENKVKKVKTLTGILLPGFLGFKAYVSGLAGVATLALLTLLKSKSLYSSDYLSMLVAITLVTSILPVIGLISRQNQLGEISLYPLFKDAYDFSLTLFKSVQLIVFKIFFVFLLAALVVAQMFSLDLFFLVKGIIIGSLLAGLLTSLIFCLGFLFNGVVWLKLFLVLIAYIFIFYYFIISKTCFNNLDIILMFLILINIPAAYLGIKLFSKLEFSTLVNYKLNLVSLLTSEVENV